MKNVTETMERISFYATKEEKALLKSYCDRTKRSLTEVLRELIRDNLEDNRND